MQHCDKVKARKDFDDWPSFLAVKLEGPTLQVGIEARTFTSQNRGWYAGG